MHLMEKAKQGLVLPSSLPPELHPSFHPPPSSSISSVQGMAGSSVSESRTRKMSEESAVTFEDRRKQNFELGRMELQRRKQARQEQLEREAVSDIHTYMHTYIHTYVRTYVRTYIHTHAHAHTHTHTHMYIHTVHICCMSQTRTA